MMAVSWLYPVWPLKCSSVSHRGLPAVRTKAGIGIWDSDQGLTQVVWALMTSTELERTGSVANWETKSHLPEPQLSNACSLTLASPLLRRVALNIFTKGMLTPDS